MTVLDKRTKRHILWLLAIMFFLGMSATDIYIASLPQMVIDFHSVPSMVNLTLSSYSLGVALSVLFTGEISNRYGRRRCLLVGVAGFSICAFLIALLPWIELVIALRFIQGFGCAVILIVPRLILKDCMDEREQIRGTGILLTGLILSPAIAPLVGAFLAEYFGWRSCFVASGLCGVILCYLANKILPETNLNKLKRFPHFGSYLIGYVSFLRSRVFLSLTLIYATAVGAYFAFIGISSYLYIDHWHLSPLSYSYIFIYVSLAYLIGNQIMQFLNRRRVAGLKIIAIGVYSTFIGSLIIYFAVILNNPEWTVFLVTLGVLFMRVANALINPPVQIQIMSYFNPKSAQALGLNICIGFIINSLATYLVTLDPLHPFLSLVLVSGSFVLLCLLIYRFNRKLLGQSIKI